MNQNQQLPRVLIGFPISNREWVLPLFLKHIDNLNYPKDRIDLYAIVNNSEDNTLQLMKEFKQKHNNEYNSIKIEEYQVKHKFKDARITQTREKYTYHLLSELRNKLLKKCVELDCDYLLSVDTDIIVKSELLNQLLGNMQNNSDISICASLIYNGYLFTPPELKGKYDSIENAYKYPNILKLNNNGSYSHIVNYRVKNANLNEAGTLTEVDFTGAVSLIKLDVCKVATYAYHTQGEDEVFSRTAREFGYRSWCDLGCYSQHMMSKEIMDLYLAGELKFNNGEVVVIE